ncbi:type II toxin-antitoxin system CcdA family antitoxin [Novosphingobium sp. HBC54]|uniref:Type II toxin-antitoxin system CcdA family antitoxin n=2 Tax=Novosphingobium cyanobacteriorum TaxID=3024215 RepID=A0ABT6CLJ5_9SPHN|nr:type II toxin-antitoxin system CcdA family antitoxin [Novosphingobium cyanobacteriorum]
MTEHSHKVPDAPVRKPTNVTLDSALVAEARSLGINISRACEAGLRQELSAEKGKRWQEENADALRSHNEWVENNGLPLAEFRKF